MNIILNKLRTILTFIWDHRSWLLMGIIILLSIIMMSQCNTNSKLKTELVVKDNNLLAMTDEIINYKDELNRSNAEKHAYQLTQEQLMNELNLLKNKNKEYVSYINSNLGIRDTIILETVIEKEKIDSTHSIGIISINKNESFGQSSRELSINIPYDVLNNNLTTGQSNIILNQNIFVEGWLDRNTKTKETYLHLRSDYPNLTFNSGLGVVALNGSSYSKEMRKRNGIGLAVGPSLGVYYFPQMNSWKPAVGLSVTIGYTYTPKWTQWGK